MQGLATFVMFVVCIALTVSGHEYRSLDGVRCVRRDAAFLYTILSSFCRYRHDCCVDCFAPSPARLSSFHRRCSAQSGNNIQRPYWGTAKQRYLRELDLYFYSEPDVTSTPRGGPFDNARTMSNAFRTSQRFSSSCKLNRFIAVVSSERALHFQASVWAECAARDSRSRKSLLLGKLAAGNRIIR
jgi:hypothetical protein